jgi:flavocytochrome c
LSQLGGHSCKRTHRNKSGPNVGFAITSTLQKKLNDYPNVQVITSAIAEQILHKEADPEHPKGGIRGLEVKKDDRTFIIETPVVIMATGGFSANKALLQRFAPGMENFPTTNGPWALGEGVQLAEQLGADLVHMDKVQLHPTGFINPKDRNARQRFLAPEAIRGSGAILLNVNGKRFVNELQTRDVVSQAILAQPEHRANMLLFEGATALESALGFYKHIGIVKEVHSVAEAAEYFGLDAQALLEELNQYADVAQHPDTKQDLFGKTVFPFPLKPIASVDEPVSIHVMEIEPAVHYTMGGVKINENAQVLKFNGDVIEGLFAAGEVSGGLHGANRLGGNSLAECVVFGRIAARQAVEKVSAVVAL